MDMNERLNVILASTEALKKECDILTKEIRNCIKPNTNLEKENQTESRPKMEPTCLHHDESCANISPRDYCLSKAQKHPNLTLRGAVRVEITTPTSSTIVEDIQPQIQAAAAESDEETKSVQSLCDKPTPSVTFTGEDIMDWEDSPTSI